MVLICGTLFCHDDHLCQIIFKSHHEGLSYGPDTILIHKRTHTHTHTRTHAHAQRERARERERERERERGTEVNSLNALPPFHGGGIKRPDRIAPREAPEWLSYGAESCHEVVSSSLGFAMRRLDNQAVNEYFFFKLGKDKAAKGEGWAQSFTCFVQDAVGLKPHCPFDC